VRLQLKNEFSAESVIAGSAAQVELAGPQRDA
jgi:hypothetical protein